jgi:type II secretory pathway pseudopilin PulG
MTTNMYFAQKKEGGFALLISLLVVGVVISVGLSILDLSVKQVRLSSIAKESELSFHAANAGMECARYWRREGSADIESGQTINPTCFNGTRNTNTVTDLTSSNANGDGDVYQYEFDFTWGVGTGARCTSVNMIVGVADVDGSGVLIEDIDDLVFGYPAASGSDKFCEAGSRCSTISVQGYNLPCANTGGFGVVQREVLLEY